MSAVVNEQHIDFTKRLVLAEGIGKRDVAAGISVLLDSVCYRVSDWIFFMLMTMSDFVLAVASKLYVLQR